MIVDYTKLALKNLRRRKLRSWLTMIGIFISITTIFVLVSVSLGLQDAVNEQFRLLGTDKLFIQPKGQLGGPGTGGAVTLTSKDVDTLEKIKGIKDLTYYSVGNGQIEYSNEKRYLMVVGIPLDKSDVFYESSTIKPEEGSLFGKNDINKVLIGSQFKHNNVFKKPVRAGDKIVINDKEFKVRSILKSIGNPQDDKLIYMPLEDFKNLFKTGNNIESIIVQILPGEDISDIASSIEKKLRKSRGVTEKTQDFTLLTPEELLASFGNILQIVTSFLLGIAAISLLVGGIGIANTMYTSVLERTKEIGVMKSVGAKNSDILYIFLLESGLLGLVGGIIGVSLGYITSKIIEFIAITQLGTTLLRAVTPYYLFFGCLFFAFLVGSISGFVPAYQAAKIKPADTLRYE